MATDPTAEIEALLAAALVPEEEQPYPVPENWVWVRLGNAVAVNMGQSPPGEHTNAAGTGVPLIGGPADMGDEHPTAARYTSRPTKTCAVGDLVISVRATIGKTDTADRVYCLGRGVAGLNPLVVESALLRHFVEASAQELSGTGTTFLQVSKDDLFSFPLPLPPPPEQQRLAEKLDSLLAKIAEARDLMARTRDRQRPFSTVAPGSCPSESAQSA